MIDDGYGEDELWLEEKIAGRQRLLEIQASERGVSDPGMRDDLIQEGRIKIWDVLMREPDAAGLLSVATKRRMMKLVTQETTWFGQEGRQGLERDPLRRSWDSTDRDDDDTPPLEIVAADILSGVELAYHAGEIAEAINALPEKHREYVVLRFWGGLTNPEIAAIQEVNSGNMARTWNQAIRPVLAERLEHLVDA